MLRRSDLLGPSHSMKPGKLVLKQYNENLNSTSVHIFWMLIYFALSSMLTLLPHGKYWVKHIVRGRPATGVMYNDRSDEEAKICQVYPSEIGRKNRREGDESTYICREN